MKKQTRIITMIAIITLTMMLMTSTLTATATERIEGPSPGSFGKPTSIEPEIVIGGFPTESSNINRSKDSAFVPPAFGSPSADTLGTGIPLSPGLTSIPMLPHSSGSIGTTVSAPLDSATILIPPRSVYESANSVSLGSFTPSDSLRDANGSIGTLSIPRLRVSANVYAGETLENLARGIGHFNMTSAWHGNVGLSAHNRGIANFFGQIHTLREGDEIVYTTNLGTRTYAVFLVRQIHETDFSYLGWTNDNILTLVTCVRDIPELRYVVQAREI